jgi:hypothetical protein
MYWKRRRKRVFEKKGAKQVHMVFINFLKQNFFETVFYSMIIRHLLVVYTSPIFYDVELNVYGFVELLPVNMKQLGFCLLKRELYLYGDNI